MPSWHYNPSEEFKTLNPDFDSEVEQGIIFWRFPKRTFILPYNNAHISELDTIRAFFKQMFGAAKTFWYFDFIKMKWTDEFVARGIANLIHAIAEDGGVQTDETVAANSIAANDMNLLPASPQENDAYYFGGSIKFDTVRLNVGTAGVGTWTLTYEYWNGSAWVALSYVSDGTNGFTTAGINDINFLRPSDWQKRVLLTYDNYWIRARVSSFTSKTTQPLGTKAWHYQRVFDLPSKDTLEGNLKIYLNGIEKTVNTDWLFIPGTGEGGADQVGMFNALVSGDLLTADFNGNLRIRGRFKENSLSWDILAPDLCNFSVKIYERKSFET